MRLDRLLKCRITCVAFAIDRELDISKIPYNTIEQQSNSPLTQIYFNHRLTLATCYQLAQSVLKKGFALAKKAGQGEVGGFQHGVPCTWQLPWLAVEKPWSALAGPFPTLLAQTCSGTTPLVGAPFLDFSTRCHAHGSCLGWL